MMLSLLALVPLALAPAPIPRVSGPGAARDVVAVRAGTIHLVEGGQVLQGGAVLVIEDGRITAVGSDVEVPPGARVVDYGADAVIAPGLVAADSAYGESIASDRTADPSVLAVDGFDPYATHVLALQEGVTSAYLSPAHGRLIAGQGAVVKLAGPRDLPDENRVLSASAAIHGSVGEEARKTPGYWEPPMPATVDVGLGVAEPQLPRTLMGAVVALGELVELAGGNADLEPTYGPGVGAVLHDLIAAKRPWRMGASSETEIRALLGFFTEKGLPLVIDGAQGASELAGELASAGVSVVVQSPLRPNRGGRDFGRSRDDRAPRYDVASRLERAGVRFAISTADDVDAADLRFAAAVASGGGLDREAALRAITLAPAEILGVGDRVGSLTAGKDADFAVYNAHPLDPGSSVLATWIDGEIVYKHDESGAVVLSVDELHLGDGEVLRPGEVLLSGGRIREVGHRVGRPSGATVVRGKAAMPGMIDALGHLGLEGSKRVPATRFDLGRIVDAPDETDRRVARAGVTTVVLSPRGASRTGAPMLAYKPAADGDPGASRKGPTALRFGWTEKNRLESGNSVRELLEKAVAYAKKWEEYEEKMAAWTPPESAGSGGESAEEGSGASDEKSAPEGAAKVDEEKEASSEKPTEKPGGKKKGKKGDEEPAKPITGAWETHVAVPPFEKARLRLYVLDEEGKVSGSLRCASLSDDLVQVSGTRVDRKVELSGDGSRGRITLAAALEDGKLVGKVTQGGTSVDVSLEQTSTTYEIAKRSERRKVEEKKEERVKGQPREPNLDPDLEPLRRAIQGEGAVVVEVSREDEILDCVAAFEEAGIRPVLLGAEDAWRVADRIRDRIAGVLLDQRVLVTEPKTGAKTRNRYAELAEAGIPVAFHSDAEEGAADLPEIAAYAVARGMSPEVALRALTSDAAHMYGIDGQVGLLAPGLDADVVLLDGSPLDLSAHVVRVWVAGEEVR